MRALWSTTARLFRRKRCDDRTSRSDWKSSPGYRIRLAGPNARLCRSGSCRHVARESDLSAAQDRTPSAFPPAAQACGRDCLRVNRQFLADDFGDLLRCVSHNGQTMGGSAQGCRSRKSHPRGFAREGESGHHHMRCLPSSIYLRCSSPIRSNRGGSWKSRPLSSSPQRVGDLTPSRGGLGKELCGCDTVAVLQYELAHTQGASAGG